MNLGRTCPRFKDFESIYPSAVRLQGLLCDYFAVIIRICQRSTEVYKKSGASFLPMIPLFTSDAESAPTWLLGAFVKPFEAEFGPFQAELDSLSQNIQGEISLASVKAQKQEQDLQEKERQEARSSRNILGKVDRRLRHADQNMHRLQVQIGHQKLMKKRKKALDSLSVYEYKKTFRRIRRECVPGTSSWICETPEFQSWLIDHKTTFSCVGKRESFQGYCHIRAC